ncbi:MAG: S9 family peptidase [Thermoanaerobaculia bacterium]|nr:S9 family peptidase [Thermoanaerobaculia bacterium]
MKKLALALLLATTLRADDLERTITLMAKIGSASGPSFAPDSRRIAFITNISGSPQVWMITAEGGYPQQVTSLDDPVTGMEWSPSGDLMGIVVAPGGGLNSQIYVVRPDGTGLRRLTAGGKENNFFGRWTPDGKSIVFTSNQRSGAVTDIWIVDATTGKSRMVSEGEGIIGIAEVSDDGRYALMSQTKSRGDNNIYRVALDGSAKTLLTPHTPPAQFGAASFGATSDIVYLTGNPDRDLSAFGRVRIGAQGKPGAFEALISRPDAEIDTFELNPDASIAVISWNVGGRTELSFVDIATMKQHAGPKLQGDLAGGFEFAPNREKLALVVSGSNLPADIWIMEMGTPAIKQLTHSPHPGVDLTRLVRPQLVTYKADDGLALSGWLYAPASVKPPYPTVFSFHGGPEGQDRPSFNSTYQAMVAKGIAVFAPNVRGSSGFGKKFVNLDNGALRVGSVRDIKASVDHLVRTGVTDPKRAGVMGGSYGGYMVMAGVTEYPDLFAAGANLFGIINFETFFKHSEPWMAAISTIEYGDPATQGEMLRSLSPIHKVDRIKTPLMVLHGANDTNVPVIEAEQTVDSLRKRNVPVEYILFPDEGHGWRKTPNRITSTVSLVRFFGERLGIGNE